MASFEKTYVAVGYETVCYNDTHLWMTTASGSAQRKVAITAAELQTLEELNACDNAGAVAKLYRRKLAAMRITREMIIERATRLGLTCESVTGRKYAFYSREGREKLSVNLPGELACSWLDNYESNLLEPHYTAGNTRSMALKRAEVQRLSENVMQDEIFSAIAARIDDNPRLLGATQLEREAACRARNTGKKLLEKAANVADLNVWALQGAFKRNKIELVFSTTGWRVIADTMDDGLTVRKHICAALRDYIRPFIAERRRVSEKARRDRRPTVKQQRASNLEAGVDMMMFRREHPDRWQAMTEALHGA